MKQTILFLSVFLFLSNYSAVAQDEFPFLAEVEGKNVNVRSGQDVGFERLIQLQSGDKIVVVGRNYSWFKVKLPAGSKCYISSDFVKPLGGNIYEVTGGRVNVRAGAGTNFSILGQLRKGNKIRVISTKDEWTRIEPVEGIYGWIHEDFINFKSKGVPPPKVVEAPSRNIYKKRRMKQKEKERKKILMRETITKTTMTKPISVAQKVAEVAAGEPMSVTGKVTKAEEHVVGMGIYHKIIVGEDTQYYVQGPQTLVDRFINYKVKIEGTISTNNSLGLSAPLIKLRKIRFIL